MFPKPKRIKNPDLLRDFHDRPCAISNYSCHGPVAGHHIRSRGAKGSDTEDNLIAVCYFHHSQLHQIGSSRFIEKYPDLETKLRKK